MVSFSLLTSEALRSAGFLRKAFACVPHAPSVVTRTSYVESQSVQSKEMHKLRSLEEGSTS